MRLTECLPNPQYLPLLPQSTFNCNYVATSNPADRVLADFPNPRDNEFLSEASDANEPCAAVESDCGAGSNSNTHVLVKQKESISFCLSSSKALTP
jgi:hypothetical protein